MNTHLNRPIYVFIGAVLTLTLFGFIIRFFFGGNEDIWICQDNKWVAHGRPSYVKPTDPCGKKAPLPKSEVGCIKGGGVWKKMGPDPFETCNIKATDRGTICTDNSECEGWCQANISRAELREGMRGKTKKGRGTCSVWRVELGCFGMVEKGIVKTICID